MFCICYKTSMENNEEIQKLLQEFESLETLNKQMKGKLVHFPMTQIKEN